MEPERINAEGKMVISVGESIKGDSASGSPSSSPSGVLIPSESKTAETAEVLDSSPREIPVSSDDSPVSTDDVPISSDEKGGTDTPAVFPNPRAQQNANWSERMPRWVPRRVTDRTTITVNKASGPTQWIRAAIDMPPVRDGHRAVAVPPGTPAEPSSDKSLQRVFTIPNLLSVVRIIFVPIFVWLVIVDHSYGWALALLVVSVLSDWLDGKIARIWHAESKLGAVLDPVADRLLILAIPLSLAIVGIVPWWLITVLVVRDGVLAFTLPSYRLRGLVPQVIYLGKAATFALLYGLPLLLASHLGVFWLSWLEPVAWSLLLWGTALYIWTGALYIYQAILVVKTVPRRSKVLHPV